MASITRQYRMSMGHTPKLVTVVLVLLSYVILPFPQRRWREFLLPHRFEPIFR